MDAPAHTDAVIMDFMAARKIKMIVHPPYLPESAPADFFLFPRVKKELAGLILIQDTFKKEWGGTMQTTATVDFTKVFHWWFQHNEKCVTICRGYVEKT